MLRAPVSPRVAALALLACVVLGALLARGQASAGAPAADTGLTAAQRAGTLRFAPGTSPVDAQVVRDVIAGARPEARRLIDLVDGAVTVAVGPTGRPGAIGLTRRHGGDYAVTLDLGLVSRRWGARGVARVVLHELGHVVDGALVPPALRAQLDAATPPGYPCTSPQDPACAGRSAREERFAESFAKWATGDIGVGLDLGYAVPPPLDVAGWGAPLAALR